MATTKLSINSTAYTNCGATPCSIILEGTINPVMVVVDTTAPLANTANCFPLTNASGGVADIGYSGQFVYVRATKPSNTFITVVR